MDEISDGRNGDGTADIVRQKQNDLAQKYGVGYLASASALFSFENVTHDNG